MTQSHSESPDYYTRYKLEPIQFVMRNDLSFWVGNIVKYALRAGHKYQPGMTPPVRKNPHARISQFLRFSRLTQCKRCPTEGIRSHIKC